MAGRASVELKAKELGLDLTGRPDVVSAVVEQIKRREAQGWSYEAADASFELLVRDLLDPDAPPPFVVESYRVISEDSSDHEVLAEARIKLTVDGKQVIAIREGNGPVNALDRSLRRALRKAHPHLGELRLVDYKVRIMPGKHGTDAVTRVLIDTTDGEREWTTVGVHGNVIEASWLALHDAVRYGLLPAR